MKVCIAGKNEIAVHGLQRAVREIGATNVVVCPNLTDDGASRWQPSLLRFARETNIQVAPLEEIYTLDDVVFISLEFDRIVQPDRFISRKLFNFHFSLLPAYKGVFTSAWPILNGESSSGVTLHEIDAGIDTGNVIDNVCFPIDTNTTARDLYFLYLKHAATLFDKWFSKLISGHCRSSPQSSRGSTYFSRQSIDYRKCPIDLKNTAQSIHRQARAYRFREFQIPRLDGFPIGIGTVQPARSRVKAGSIVSSTEETLVLSTIDYDIAFERERCWDFFEFVSNGDIELIVKYPHNRENINFRNANGWTPFLVACHHGQIEVCKALLKAGADMKITNLNGTTALMYAKDHAVKSGDFSLCRMLIDLGFDASARDHFGKTVADYARLNQQQAAVEFFGSHSDA